MLRPGAPDKLLAPDLDTPETGRMDRRDPLIRPGDLFDTLRDERRPVLLDVRWQLGGPPAAELYAAGHLPGAVFVDLDRDLAGAPGPAGRHPLPDPGELQTRLRRWGIRSGSSVVGYDSADGTSAARAWWMLRWAGLSDVRLLDGGLAAWVAAGHPLTTDTPEPAPGDVVVRPGGMPTLDAAGAAELGARGLLLDARSPERYRGEVEPVDPVAGHIPGAISAPSTSNVGPDGRFRDPAELRRRFAALGVPVPAVDSTVAGWSAARPDTDPAPDGHSANDGGPSVAPVPVGAYCGSGVVAAHQVFALALAGVQAGLYVGSWSEWVADRNRPVAVGHQPDGRPADR
jgi:thiosulfate/3-mercaptopyruvate sulfurtransferase